MIYCNSLIEFVFTKLCITFKVFLFITQVILVGNLSQYFCEKNSLEKELSALRNDNNSELINSKEEEIQISTRNAYLYAAGMGMISFVILMNHAWASYVADTLGMKHRVLLIAAIYEKAKDMFHCMCMFIIKYGSYHL